MLDMYKRIKHLHSINDVPMPVYLSGLVFRFLLASVNIDAIPRELTIRWRRNSTSFDNF